MATTIQLKRSTSTGTEPVANDLAVGELAVNTADGKLFTKHSDNSIVTIGGDSTDAATKVTVTVDNKNGVTLNKGIPVYITGATGNTFHIAEARADSEGRMPAAGILAQQLAPDSEGLMIVIGFANGVNTDGCDPGDELFVAAGGGYTKTPPTGEANLIQKIGVVSKVSASNGAILVSGAGRSNATPNLDNDQFFLGNASNKAVATDFSTAVEAISINNVVEDTTPELGGNLDAQSNNITNLGTINTHTIPSGTGTFALTSDISDTLNTVTDRGNTTTNDIVIGGEYDHIQLTVKGNASQTADYLRLQDSSNFVGFKVDTDFNTTTDGNLTLGSTNGLYLQKNGFINFEGAFTDDYETTVTVANPTADRTITLPNATGTVALTSDIPTNNNQLTNGAGYITSADGGNADTVDSLHASSFLRSDANDSFSGAITGTGSITISGEIHTDENYVKASTGSDYAQLRFNGVYFNRSISYLLPVTNNAYALKIGGFSSGNYDWTSIDLYANGSNSLKYNDNKIWHAGNDGAGSGLDADTLDGQHASAFLTSYTETDTLATVTGRGNSTTNSITVGGLTVNGDATIDSDLVVSGNLTVSGSTTTVNTETINLADNNIVLNSNHTGAPTQDAGITIERGTSTDKVFQWNETNDYWEFDDKIQVEISGTNVSAFKINADLGTSENRPFEIKTPAADSAGSPYVITTHNALMFQTDGINSIGINESREVSFYEDGGNTKKLVWSPTSETLTFKDNVDAVFGDGTDLTIVHDGSNSSITNNTGGLTITNTVNDADVTIKSDDGSGGLANYFKADGSTGDTILYHYGSEKLKTQSGGVAVTGLLSATTKSFVIDHPIKEGYKLRHGSLEGPENGVYVRGRTKTNIIMLPEYWKGLVDEESITVNITPIGRDQGIWVSEWDNERVVLDGIAIDCFYTIYGERKDVDKFEVEYES